jgi:hypothetical protein
MGRRVACPVRHPALPGPKSALRWPFAPNGFSGFYSIPLWASVEAGLPQLQKDFGAYRGDQFSEAGGEVLRPYESIKQDFQTFARVFVTMH